MSTVNFSVPEDVKNAFNTVFEGQNKSAVIADLMREAVEREQRRQQHCSAVDRILPIALTPPVFLRQSSTPRAKKLVRDLCCRRQRGCQVVCAGRLGIA